MADAKEVAAVAAKVCRHADPRCLDDPCPFGIWRVLCDPNTREQENRDV